MAGGSSAGGTASALAEKLFGGGWCAVPRDVLNVLLLFVFS
jgi:hypothetical protein